MFFSLKLSASLSLMVSVLLLNFLLRALASLTEDTLSEELLAIEVLQELSLVLAEVLSQVVYIVVNLLLEVLVVGLAEVHYGLLKHCKAGEDQNSCEVGLDPYRVVNWG